MADLVFREFREGTDPQYNSILLDKATDNTLVEVSPTGSYQARDIVRIVYTDTYEKAVYGVCTNAVTGEFTFDENIYPVGPSSITATIYKYNSVDIEEADVYRIAVDVENGLYSKAYKQYESNVTYSLIIPAKRNEYFGGSSKIITSPNIAFADLCDSKAYGVGLSDASLDTLNNKFKSSLEFNIATR